MAQTRSLHSNVRSFPPAPARPAAPDAAPIEVYWTIKQVAERLHCGESTVKRWIGAKRLEKSKAGERTLITESALQRFVQQSTAESTAKA